jgi:hypothetical protein
MIKNNSNLLLLNSKNSRIYPIIFSNEYAKKLNYIDYNEIKNLEFDKIKVIQMYKTLFLVLMTNIEIFLYRFEKEEFKITKKLKFDDKGIIDISVYDSILIIHFIDQNVNNFYNLLIY